MLDSGEAQPVDLLKTSPSLKNQIGELSTAISNKMIDHPLLQEWNKLQAGSKNITDLQKLQLYHAWNDILNSTNTTSINNLKKDITLVLNSTDILGGLKQLKSRLDLAVTRKGIKEMLSNLPRDNKGFVDSVVKLIGEKTQGINNISQQDGESLLLSKDALSNILITYWNGGITYIDTTTQVLKNTTVGDLKKIQDNFLLQLGSCSSITDVVNLIRDINQGLVSIAKETQRYREELARRNTHKKLLTQFPS